MNLSGDDQAECPLCMEPYEVDDLNFFPCTCGYQICRFCWHRIRTDENGLCPACRKAYPENPADFKPLSQEQVAKLKAEKRQKEQQRKQRATESRKHLANVRVVQKNLVFVVGLPTRLAEPSVLKKYEYFGKFGKIHKVVINQSPAYAGTTGPSASAYVTYNRSEDALRAIQAVNNICVDNRILKTSLGTTKYCANFIKTQICPKSDCMYLHDLGDPEASFTKEEMQLGKHQEYERKLYEQLNNAMPQERKTTPSPPVLGINISNSNCGPAFPNVNKEAWPSLQNDTTQANSGGGTTTAPLNPVTDVVSATTTVTTTTSTSSTVPSSVSTTNGKQQQPQQQQQQQAHHQIAKSKQNKEKNNTSNDKTNNKKKGKEKHINNINSNNINNNHNNNNNNNNTTNNNIHVAEKHEKSAKSNKEKEKRVGGEGSQPDSNLNNPRILQTNHNKSPLFGNENNPLFSTNNFSKKVITGSKDSSPPSNGFIKGLENLNVNCDTGFSTTTNNFNEKEVKESDAESSTNVENERVSSIEESDKQLTNGLITDPGNGPFDKLNYTQKDSYNYQNGSLTYSNNSNCQQNSFNNYVSSSKFGAPVKNENVLGDSNEVFVNQANQLLTQQNYVIKQHLSQQQQQQQQQQQRNQPGLQQILLQQQQQQQQPPTVYQQPQNQYSQDFRLVQQQSQQPLNGLHAQAQQHFHYIQQHPNLRDQFLLQQKQNQILVNNYSQNGNNFIHMPGGEDLVVVDNLIPQQKFLENGLNHTNIYTCDFKLKENCKSDDGIIDKDGVDIHNRIMDDELGFDPFHETQKALADLMEKELLIQQNKQVMQYKNEQFYQQSPQNYSNQHGFDSCPRGFNHLQMNMLNQHNHMLGGKLLAQIHSQQILNSSNPKSGNIRLDGIRCTLPPPGFATPSQSGPPGHLNNFGPGAPRSTSSSKILPFINLGESSYQSHYVPNGVSKSDDWPDSLRSLVQDSSTPPPASGSSFTSAKVWNNIGNCSDWTALDPAIVSSTIPQHLALHTQSLINHQGLSQIHQSQLQNQMSQLNIGSILAHNNWSHRQSEDNWSSHIQSAAVPPPGFTLRHAEAEMKKPVISGVEGLE